MNNFTKKAIALASVICVAFTSAVSCLDKKDKGTNTDGNSTTDSADPKATNADKATNANGENTPTIDNISNNEGNVVITPFQFGTPADIGITPPDADIDLNADDPTTKKEPATEVVEVTEANGEKATDANGKTVTQIVTKPVDPASDYKSKMDARYCFWIDISKDSDYIFNDQFIKVTFKLKDNIPEKEYAVRFNPDLSSIAGRTVTPDKIVQGCIKVGGSISAQDVSSESGFVAYGDNVSAKAGDTVDYYINLKNNPGLAGMLVWIYYDSNAMDVEEIEPTGQFAEIAKKTQTGSKN